MSPRAFASADGDTRRPLAWARGTRCGRYEILAPIANGGMAQVYAARLAGEGRFERLVAIKRMLPNLVEDDGFVDMFLDEGRIAAAIDSPHVVQTLDLDRGPDGEPYLVLEFVSGVSLHHLQRTVDRAGLVFPLDLAIEVLAQAAAGLHDAHEARTPTGRPLEIVHRDVSPQNILVDARGRARITDFGVARAIERATRTNTGDLKGKHAYFAPEQLTNQVYDRRVDVWALGVVGWEVCTGRRLFGGRGTLETLKAVASEPIPPVTTYRPDAAPAIAEAISRALERDPARRWPDARAFERALRAAAAGADTAALGDFVTTHGGTFLRHLEADLRAAITPEPMKGGAARDEEESGDASGGEAEAHPITESASVPAPARDTPSITHIAIDTPAPTRPPAGARPPRRWRIAVLLAGALLALTTTVVTLSLRHASVTSIHNAATMRLISSSPTSRDEAIRPDVHDDAGLAHPPASGASVRGSSGVADPSTPAPALPTTPRDPRADDGDSQLETAPAQRPRPTRDRAAREPASGPETASASGSRAAATPTTPSPPAHDDAPAEGPTAPETPLRNPPSRLHSLDEFTRQVRP